MKRKLLFSTLLAIAIGFSSCQDRWEENKPVENPPKVLTYDEELAIVNNYTEIDTINNLYSVIITDSIMQAEHLTDPNVERIFRDIAKTNKSIKEDIQAGTTTTLTLYNNKGFKYVSKQIQIIYKIIRVNSQCSKTNGRINKYMLFCSSNCRFGTKMWSPCINIFDHKQCL